MPIMTSYAPGTFSWVDLSTPDVEASKKFYSALFGWASEDFPSGPGQTYSMMRKDGHDAAAIATQQQAGMPPFWSSYITVANVDESTEKAKSLGANVMMGPMEVMDVGRMSVVFDPTGAAFMLWEPRKHKGAAIVNDPGAFCWNELYTTDEYAAKTFYEGLFGWTSSTDNGTGGPPYTMLKNGESPAGGMLLIQPEWGPMPTHWTVYFTVVNCDAAMAQIKELGGKVSMGPMSIPNMGFFAACQDPQGAHFSIWERAANPA